MREEYKQTPIGSIPKDWNVVRLRDVLTHLRNGLTTKHNKEGKGYPVTRIETISYERIDPNKVGFVYRHRDLHKEVCYATALDKEGEIIDRREFKNKRRMGEVHRGNARDSKVAIEACSYGYPVCDFLEDRGIEVILSHPSKTRIIAEAMEKIGEDFS